VFSSLEGTFDVFGEALWRLNINMPLSLFLPVRGREEGWKALLGVSFLSGVTWTRQW
jgi:hypothetical protein